MSSEFLSYPRTPHVEGSGLQAGDSPRGMLALSRLHAGSWVFEEKVDGANSALSFDGGGNLLLQSRGHYLSLSRDVHRERHFNLFKSWASLHADALLERLEDRYVMFGEWMGALHSVFYDHLPDLFLEFDVWDRSRECFLSTPARRALLDGLPVASVPVLHSGPLGREGHPRDLVGPSVFRTPGEGWLDGLRLACSRAGDDFEARLGRLFRSSTSEGLYMKMEEGDRVLARAKWVERGFVQTILDADVHWQSAFVVPNLLGREVFGLPRGVVRPDAAGGEYDPGAPAGWAALAAHRVGAVP